MAQKPINLEKKQEITLKCLNTEEISNGKTVWAIFYCEKIKSFVSLFALAF